MINQNSTNTAAVRKPAKPYPAVLRTTDYGLVTKEGRE